MRSLVAQELKKVEDSEAAMNLLGQESNGF